MLVHHALNKHDLYAGDLEPVLVTAYEQPQIPAEQTQTFICDDIHYVYQFQLAALHADIPIANSINDTGVLSCSIFHQQTSSWVKYHQSHMQVSHAGH